jgi:hypothetical protein
VNQTSLSASLGAAALAMRMPCWLSVMLRQMFHMAISARLGIVSIETACHGEPGTGLHRISSKAEIAFTSSGAGAERFVILCTGKHIE